MVSFVKNEVIIIGTDQEMKGRISSILAKLHRNPRIERILDDIMREIWKMDDSGLRWTPEPLIELDGKLVFNPDFRKAISEQKNIIWQKLIGNIDQTSSTEHVEYRMDEQ